MEKIAETRPTRHVDHQILFFTRSTTLRSSTHEHCHKLERDEKGAVTGALSVNVILKWETQHTEPKDSTRRRGTYTLPVMCVVCRKRRYVARISTRRCHEGLVLVINDTYVSDVCTSSHRCMIFLQLFFKTLSGTCSFIIGWQIDVFFSSSRFHAH